MAKLGYDEPLRPWYATARLPVLTVVRVRKQNRASGLDSSRETGSQPLVAIMLCRDTVAADWLLSSGML